MGKESALKTINKDRDQTEAAFVFSLWRDPELYESFLDINAGKDETLVNSDAKFYFQLGKMLYLSGYRTFDHVTLDTFLASKDKIRKRFEEYGGYREVQQLISIVDSSNVDAYFDKIKKMNSLNKIYEEYRKAFDDPEKFAEMTSEDVYTYFDYINNDTAIVSGHNERIENMFLPDDYIEQMNKGEHIGFSYWKYSPILNYITLGAAPGSLYMIGGYSGTGKSSYVFGNMLMGLHNSGVKVGVISNEMLIDNYQHLLIEHVLINELNYWGLTRKQLKQGGFSDEQKAKLAEARRIINEKYADIQFVKTFDNNINKILKYLRKLKAQGVQVVMYDTFKSDDGATDSGLWQTLMLDARKLFQCCSKLGICCITTYQLALHTENQRYLSAGCLSNSKQIKEVYETMVYMRRLWEDEYTGERYDVHPYRFRPDNKKIKEEIQLDPDKKYMLFFVDKTRADEDKKIVIFEWNPRYNVWKELGYAKVINDHRLGVT